jgi:hypothetical protein
VSDSWLPPPPPPQRPAADKASGSVGDAAEELSPELTARVKRVRWWLLLVPFAFPMWMRLRADHPGAASRLRFELGVSIFSSVLVLLLGCCMLSLLVARQQIVDALVPIVVNTGLVR